MVNCHDEGRAPYSAETLEEVKEKMKTTELTFKKSLSKEAKDIMLQLLKADPSERIALDKVMRHPFILKHRDEFESNKDNFKYIPPEPEWDNDLDIQPPVLAGQENTQKNFEEDILNDPIKQNEYITQKLAEAKIKPEDVEKVYFLRDEKNNLKMRVQMRDRPLPKRGNSEKQKPSALSHRFGQSFKKDVASPKKNERSGNKFENILKDEGENSGHTPSLAENAREAEQFLKNIKEPVPFYGDEVVSRPGVNRINLANHDLEYNLIDNQGIIKDPIGDREITPSELGSPRRSDLDSNLSISTLGKQIQRTISTDKLPQIAVMQTTQQPSLTHNPYQVNNSQVIQNPEPKIDLFSSGNIANMPLNSPAVALLSLNQPKDKINDDESKDKLKDAQISAQNKPTIEQSKGQFHNTQFGVVENILKKPSEGEKQTNEIQKGSMTPQPYSGPRSPNPLAVPLGVYAGSQSNLGMSPSNQPFFGNYLKPALEHSQPQPGTQQSAYIGSTISPSFGYTFPPVPSSIYQPNFEGSSNYKISPGGFSPVQALNQPQLAPFEGNISPSTIQQMDFRIKDGPQINQADPASRKLSSISQSPQTDDPQAERKSQISLKEASGPLIPNAATIAQSNLRKDINNPFQASQEPTKNYGNAVTRDQTKQQIGSKGTSQEEKKTLQTFQISPGIPSYNNSANDKLHQHTGEDMRKIGQNFIHSNNDNKNNLASFEKTSSGFGTYIRNPVEDTGGYKLQTSLARPIESSIAQPPQKIDSDKKQTDTKASQEEERSRQNPPFSNVEQRPFGKFPTDSAQSSTSFPQTFRPVYQNLSQTSTLQKEGQAKEETAQALNKQQSSISPSSNFQSSLYFNRPETKLSEPTKANQPEQKGNNLQGNQLNTTSSGQPRTDSASIPAQNKYPSHQPSKLNEPLTANSQFNHQNESKDRSYIMENQPGQSNNGISTSKQSLILATSKSTLQFKETSLANPVFQSNRDSPNSKKDYIRDGDKINNIINSNDLKGITKDSSPQKYPGTYLPQSQVQNRYHPPLSNTKVQEKQTPESRDKSKPPNLGQSKEVFNENKTREASVERSRLNSNTGNPQLSGNLGGVLKLGSPLVIGTSKTFTPPFVSDALDRSFERKPPKAPKADERFEKITINSRKESLRKEPSPPLMRTAERNSLELTKKYSDYGPKVSNETGGITIKSDKNGQEDLRRPDAATRRPLVTSQDRSKSQTIQRREPESQQRPNFGIIADNKDGSKPGTDNSQHSTFKPMHPSWPSSTSSERKSLTPTTQPIKEQYKAPSLNTNFTEYRPVHMLEGLGSLKKPGETISYNPTGNKTISFTHNLSLENNQTPAVAANNPLNTDRQAAPMIYVPDKYQGKPSSLLGQPENKDQALLLGSAIKTLAMPTTNIQGAPNFAMSSTVIRSPIGTENASVHGKQSVNASRDGHGAIYAPKPDRISSNWTNKEETHKEPISFLGTHRTTSGLGILTPLINYSPQVGQSPSNPIQYKPDQPGVKTLIGSRPNSPFVHPMTFPQGSAGSYTGNNQAKPDSVGKIEPIQLVSSTSRTFQNTISSPLTQTTTIFSKRP